MIKKLNVDQKMQVILAGQKQGKTREAVAVELGYKSWRGIDVLMRRKGYIYKNGNYILSNEPRTPNLNDEIPEAIKVVLDQIEMGNKDLSNIALKAGFKDRKSLAEHLRNHGWLWCSKEKTYLNKEIKIQRSENKGEGSTKPSTKQQDASINSDQTLWNIVSNDPLAHLIQDFCKETGMSQQEILKQALIQFFEKHGYTERLVKSCG